MIDEQLNFKDHLAYVLKTLQNKVGILETLRSCYVMYQQVINLYHNYKTSFKLRIEKTRNELNWLNVNERIYFDLSNVLPQYYC